MEILFHPLSKGIFRIIIKFLKRTIKEIDMKGLDHLLVSEFIIEIRKKEEEGKNQLGKKLCRKIDC